MSRFLLRGPPRHCKIYHRQLYNLYIVNPLFRLSFARLSRIGLFKETLSRRMFQRYNLRDGTHILLVYEQRLGAFYMSRSASVSRWEIAIARPAPL